MTTASEGDNGTRRMRRYEQPKVQLDMPDVWHGLCLGACAVTYRLLGFAPDSDQKFQPDQHFEIALRVAEFMLSNMRDKDTGYLSTIFNIINRRHGYEFSVDYERKYNQVEARTDYKQREVQMNEGQRHIFESISDKLYGEALRQEHSKSSCFIDAPGGAGK